jgi:hypothetical protein
MRMKTKFEKKNKMRGLPRILNWMGKLKGEIKFTNEKTKNKKLVDQIWKKITNYNNGSKDEIEIWQKDQ